MSQETDRTHYKVEKELGQGGISAIIQRWIENNPDQVGKGKKFANRKEVEKKFLELNDFRDPITGKRCDDLVVSGPLIREGDIINTPDGKEITGGWEAPCPPEQAPIIEVVAEAPIVLSPDSEIIVVTGTEAEAKLKAQLITSAKGRANYAQGADAYDFFLGQPPRDPAALGHNVAGKYNGRTIVKNYADGTDLIDIRTLDKATQERLDKIVLRRAGDNSGRDGELWRKPSQTHYYNTTTGEPIATNAHFHQKLEENARYVVDSDGNLLTVVGGTAHISLDRRLNPYHGNIWADAMTATNVVNILNDTGEVHKTILSLAAIEHAYTPLADRFVANKTDALDANAARDKGTQAADAEKLLQLNLSLALHPLVWSVDNLGTRIGDVSVVREQMQNVFDSENFKNLAQDDKERLEGQYRPYMDLLDNPAKLDAAIVADGGRDQWYVPTDDWAKARVKETARDGGRDTYFIVDGYGDQQGVKRSKQTPEAREAQALAVGTALGRNAWRETIRPPQPMEYELAAGVLFNTKLQTPDNMARERATFLSRLQNDPELLDAYISYVSEGKGSHEKLTQLMFDVTRNGVFSDVTDNHELLAIEGKESQRTVGPRGNITRTSKTDPRLEADKFVGEVAALMGGEAFRNKVDYNGFTPFRSIAKLVTLGAWDPHRDQNQNQGKEEFTAAMRERWKSADETVRDEVRNGFRMLAAQAEIAQALAIGTNQPQLDNAATRFVIAMDRDVAEDQGKGVISPAYAHLRKKVAETQPHLIDNQKIVQLNAQAQIGARIEAGLERKAANGEALARVDMNTMHALLEQANGNGVVATNASILGSDPYNIAGLKLAGVSLFDTSAAAAVTNAAQLGAVLATANNVTLVSQGQTNVHTTKILAESSPELFSMMVISALAGDNNQGSLRTLVERIDRGKEEFSAYADKLTGYAQRIANAQSGAARVSRDANGNLVTAVENPDAIMAEAMADMRSFLSDPEHAGQRALAGSMLSQYIAGDPQLAGRMARDFGVVIDADSLKAAGTNADKAAGSDDASRALLAGIMAKATNDERLALSTLLAKTDPEARMAGFEQFLAKHSEQERSRNAGVGISYMEIIKVGLIIYGLDHNPPNPDMPTIPGDIIGCENCPRPPVPPGPPPIRG